MINSYLESINYIQSQSIKVHSTFAYASLQNMHAHTPCTHTHMHVADTPCMLTEYESIFNLNNVQAIFMLCKLVHIYRFVVQPGIILEVVLNVAKHAMCSLIDLMFLS